MTVRHIQVLCSYLHNSEDFRPSDSQDERTRRSILQLGFEQFPYQRDLHGSLARTLAIFEGTTRRHPEKFKENILDLAFEMPFSKVFLCALLIDQMAKVGGGRVPIQAFIPEALESHLENVTNQDIEHLMELITQNDSEIRASVTLSVRPSPMEVRWVDNPLRKKPLVRLPDGSVFLPEPDNLFIAVGLNRTLERLWEKLQQDYGKVGHYVQKYVEDLFSQIPNIQVIPESRYSKGKEPRDTIDLFVVLNDLVLLVEVKSRRPRGALTSGDVDPKTAYDKEFQDALDQIERTVSDYKAGLISNLSLPQDRPWVGIVVTSERYHLANSPLFTSRGDGQVPILRAALDEIEAMVQFSEPTISQQIKAVIEDEGKSQWDLAHSFEGMADLETRNSLVVEEFDKVLSLIKITQPVR